MRDRFVHSTVAAKPETETGFRFLTSNTALDNYYLFVCQLTAMNARMERKLYGDRWGWKWNWTRLETETKSAGMSATSEPMQASTW